MKKLNEIRKTVFEGFSLKKLLLCVLCSIIVTTFVGFTILFINKANDYIGLEILNSVDRNAEELKELGKNMQEQAETIQEQMKAQKEKYGEDYPAEGIFLYQTIMTTGSYSICEMYTSTLLMGIILGTLVYIIFIQKAKGVQMLVETTICGTIILVILVFVNLGYSSIMNAVVNNIGTSSENYGHINYYIYDIDNSNILYVFIGIIGISYVVNLIYQKILANKFNKKLNK